MNHPWRFAMLGAVGGAVLAVALVFASAAFGFLPQNEAAVRTYLISHPEILAAMMEKLQALQDDSDDAARQAAVNKIGLKAFFDPKVAYITGPENAKISFVEFFDYNCPYCRASLPAVKKFYQQHKRDARFAFIEFPIKGPDSTFAARAAIAARRQPDKYIDFYFALMDEQEMATEPLVLGVAKKVGLDVAQLEADMKDPSVDKAIDASHNLAMRAKIDGTPAFIINGKMREGAVDDEILNQLIKS